MYIPRALDTHEWIDEGASKINKMKYSFSKISKYKNKCIIGLLLNLCIPLFSQEIRNSQSNNSPFLVILGTLQDGGSPHIGCKKNCCNQKDPSKKVVSIGVVDPTDNKKFLFEASPDIVDQIKTLDEVSGNTSSKTIDGIFLTHAHIGHYSGLMYLGKEAWNAHSIPIFAMPKMKNFLEKNGPWSQLISLNNIKLLEIQNRQTKVISKNINVTPYTVPHRDEFSETIGYKIKGVKKSALFIPDIDKWSKWDLDIKEMIKEVDYAFIDGTFFGVAELNNRNMAEIPHPLISESIELFKALDEKEKNKIWFIHLNHSNPALDKNSAEHKLILEKGFHITEFGQLFPL